MQGSLFLCKTIALSVDGIRSAHHCASKMDGLSYEVERFNFCLEEQVFPAIMPACSVAPLAWFCLQRFCFLRFALSGKVQASPAEDEFASAEHIAATGNFAESVAHWKKADKLFEKAKNSSSQVDTEIHLAAAYHALGQTRLAVDTLTHSARDCLSRRSKTSRPDQSGARCDLHSRELRQPKNTTFMSTCPGMRTWRKQP